MRRTPFVEGWEARPHASFFLEMVGAAERWQPVTVEVYSDAEEVELLLDGRSLGVQEAGEGNRFRASFEVTYEPGELTAVTRAAGAETGRFSLRSATGDVRLTAAAERDVVRALAVVRPSGGGTITVTASAEGCRPAVVTVEAR